MVKNLTAMLETWDRSLGPIPASGCPPGGGHGNPLQYSCLENPMDRGAWQTTPHGVAKSWTQLSEFHIHITFSTHSALLILFFFICSEFCHTMKWTWVYMCSPSWSPLPPPSPPAPSRFSQWPGALLILKEMPASFKNAHDKIAKTVLISFTHILCVHIFLIFHAMREEYAESILLLYTQAWRLFPRNSLTGLFKLQVEYLLRSWSTIWK